MKYQLVYNLSINEAKACFLILYFKVLCKGFFMWNFHMEFGWSAK